MPERLLSLLSDLPQTGDALGARLGLGRVSVNTLARKLAEGGVPVQVGRAGYSLPPGTPAPALTARPGPLGLAMRYVGTVGSTQDEARAWADDPLHPAPHGAVVVAERQTQGRGRRGRPWTTTPGTLVFSVLLRHGPDGSPLTLPELARLPLAAGVALHEACANGAGAVGGLKWPNDLLAPDGRKLAGLLLEADLRGEEARRAVLGVGVNVGGAPDGAAHLGEVRPDLTRADVLGAFLVALHPWLGAPADQVLDAWRAASVTLGRRVRVDTPQGTLEGIARDLDAHGGLIVETSRGLRTVSAGDVQLVGDLRELATGGPSP